MSFPILTRGPITLRTGWKWMRAMPVLALLLGNGCLAGSNTDLAASPAALDNAAAFVQDFLRQALAAVLF